MTSAWPPWQVRWVGERGTTGGGNYAWAGAAEARDADGRHVGPTKPLKRWNVPLRDNMCHVSWRVNSRSWSGRHPTSRKPVIDSPIRPASDPSSHQNAADRRRHGF